MPDYRPQQPLTRLEAWAARYAGIEPWWPVMSSPPTITLGTNVSSINAGYSNGNCLVKGNDPILYPVGSNLYVDSTDGGTSPNDSRWMKGQHVSGVGPSYTRTASSAPVRYQFQTDAPAIDICYNDSQVGGIMLLVDGQLVSAEQIQTTTGSFVSKYVKIDFGTNVVTWGTAQPTLTPSAGGTGHAFGDIITFNGGTGGASGTAIQAKVTNVTGGVVAGLTTIVNGAYTSLPTGTLSQASTTGSGSGLQVSAAFFRRVNSTRRMRKIEIILSGAVHFYGLVVDSASAVLPVLRNDRVPKVVFVGDSITAGTYLQGAHISSRVAKALGWWDQFSVSAVGGTGWSVDGQGIKWSDSHRIDDLVAQNADVYVFHGSQNDAGLSGSSTLSNLVRDTINAIQDRVPSCYILGTGPVIGVQALSDTIKAGYVAAKNQSRVRYIDNFVPRLWLASGNNYTVTSDGNHLSQDGQDFYAAAIAHAIAINLTSMIQVGY